MSCADFTCIKINTCKWDSSVSKVYCENTYYPDPEPPQIEREPEVIYVEPQPVVDEPYIPTIKNKKNKIKNKEAYQW